MPNYFPNGCTPSPTMCILSSCSLFFLILGFIRHFKFWLPSECEILSFLCDFNLLFPDFQQSESIFSCLSVIHSCSFMKHMFKSLPVIYGIVCLLWICRNYIFYIFVTWCVANILLTCLFTYLCWLLISRSFNRVITLFVLFLHNCFSQEEYAGIQFTVSEWLPYPLLDSIRWDESGVDSVYFTHFFSKQESVSRGPQKLQAFVDNFHLFWGNSASCQTTISLKKIFLFLKVSKKLRKGILTLMVVWKDGAIKSAI